MWLDATVCDREQQKGNSRVRSEGWSYNQEETAFLINSEGPELKLSGSGKLRRAPKLGCHPLWPPRLSIILFSLAQISSFDSV